MVNDMSIAVMVSNQNKSTAQNITTDTDLFNMSDPNSERGSYKYNETQSDENDYN